MATKDTSTTDPETPAVEEPTPSPAENSPVEDQSPRERAEQRRAERQAQRDAQPSTTAPEKGPRDDAGRTTSLDTFANPHEKALAALQTAEDSNGIERIIGPVDTTWVPAPLEASDEEKAAADRRNRMFDQASKKRLEQLAGEIKAEDTGVNDPSQGGSQTSTETVAEAAQKENS